MSAEYEKLLVELKLEFPKFEIVKKEDSFLMKVINVCLMIITLGMMRTFMTRFTTTIGYKVYVPPTWDNLERIGTLMHEAVHMRQLEEYGTIWFSVSYLFLWFPLGFAHFRKKYEQEAYEVSMRYWSAKYGIKAIDNQGYRRNMVERFTSAKYFWTWPWRRSIELWFDVTVRKIKSDMGLSLTQ